MEAYKYMKKDEANRNRLRSRKPSFRTAIAAVEGALTCHAKHGQL